MIIYRIALFAIMAFSFSFSVANDLEQVRDDYLKNGQEIVDMVNADSIDLAKVKAHVIQLTRDSVVLAQAYIVKHPEGAVLLQEAINSAAILEGSRFIRLGPMSEQSFTHLENHWHDLGYVTGKDFGIDMDDEDNEHFTDPLHVMIHPFMVLQAAKDGDKDAMKAEMEEGMEQIILTIESL